MKQITLSLSLFMLVLFVASCGRLTPADLPMDSRVDVRDDDAGNSSGGDADPGDQGGGDQSGDVSWGDQTGSGGDGGSGSGTTLTCTSCHGNDTNYAPPEGLGRTLNTNERGVGAHQSHLGPSNWRKEILCDACHIVPAALNDVGHIDTPMPAELTWGSLARADGGAPQWDTVTCSGVYCHGATLMSGGTNLTPNWTTVDGTQAACNTCHSRPPLDTHPNATACHLCHDEIVDAAMSFIAPERHIDGKVDVNAGCDLCHGYPPTAATEVTAGAGGAHIKHFVGQSFMCRTCHGHNGSGPQHNQGGGIVQRANVDIDFDLTVSFPGGTTISNGGTPTYNPGTFTCTVGCHNPIPGDVANLNNTKVWTDPDISCAECHDQPGTAPVLNHDLDPNAQGAASIRAGCQECHNTVAHLEGAVQIQDPDPTDAFSFATSGTSGLCRTCHDGGAGTFFEGRTPQDQTLYWTLPSAHQVAGIDCVDCHDRHGSIAGTVLVNREEDLCFKCHDGTRASTDIKSEFAKGTNGANVFHHPVNDAEQVGGRTVECVDCHNPHQSISSNPQQGVPGIDINGAAVGFGTGNPRNISEYELCFQCHGDTFEASRPRTTNKRTDFNPANGAYHPVASAGRNSSAAMQASLLPGLTTSSVIKCTDCHNNELTADVNGVANGSPASPQGPHGSSNAFILRANYWSDPTGPGSWNANNYELCFLCHRSQEAFTDKNNGAFTNFGDGPNDNLHALHVFNKANRNVTCANCHYNTHGNKNITTTNYDIDGTVYTSAPVGFKTRNVSFSPDVTGAGGPARPTFWIDTATRERRCYLSCHGKAHTPKKYIPVASRDNDSLTTP